MQNIFFAAAIAALSASQAFAGCEFTSSPCYTDSAGGTYTTRQNFGGGYTTYRDGSEFSRTNQNNSGGYTESYGSGGSRSFNYDPYGSSFGNSGYK